VHNSQREETKNLDSKETQRQSSIVEHTSMQSAVSKSTEVLSQQKLIPSMQEPSTQDSGVMTVQDFLLKMHRL